MKTNHPLKKAALAAVLCVAAAVSLHATGNGDALIQAVKNNDSAKAQQLIKSGANVNAKDESGMTVLMYAVMAGDTNIVNALLEAKANVNAKNYVGVTPIIFAAMDGHTDITRSLIKAKADVNARPDASVGCMTALHWAVCNNYDAVAKLLVAAGANVNAKNSEGQTALMFAIANRNEPMASLLMQSGARMDDVYKKILNTLGGR